MQKKKTIIYKHARFEFNDKLGYHQLAISLADNQKLIFPTIYLLNHSDEIYYSNKGFLFAKGLFSVLSHN